MNSSYNPIAEEEGLHITTTPYIDKDDKNDLTPPSSSTSTTLLLDSTSQLQTLSSHSPLKQQFIYLTLSILLILISTTLIVHISTKSCRHPTTTSKTTHLAPPLTSLKLAHQALSHFPSPLRPPTTYTTCGPNTTTALANKCHFDLISFTWLPHACYDAELTADFLSLAPWKYSHDQNGTSLISPEELKRGEVNTGFVTWEYHLMHCLYTWKKLVRHLERGGAMDWYVLEFSHVRHCADLLVEGVEVKRGVWNSEFFVQFPLCGFV